MPNTKLHPYQLEKIRPLEVALKEAVADGDADRALDAAKKIQDLFPDDRAHHRLLRAKLWAFEACVDANRLAFAERGFIGVRKLAGESTRLALEAGGLLAVVLLRQGKTSDAKQIIRDVISRMNNIASDRTRHQFQRRLVERIEEECILVELVGSGDVSSLDANEIHEKSIVLLQKSSDAEIIQMIGNSVPASGVRLLSEVRKYSVKQLPGPDRILLPGPERAESPSGIGEKTFSLLKRVAWKTLCKPSSPIYQLWSKRVPKVFNEGYFAAAIVTSMTSLNIGLPLIASGLVALIMKNTAEDFCERAKPRGLMISSSDRSD